MATANPKMIKALLDTADRISDPSTRYQWTHQGACNCGHLAQTVTQLSRAEIHKLALQRAGDWSEHAIDYCPSSRYPIDHVITTLLELGLSTDDLVHLERLSQREILRAIDPQYLPLQKNRREDVVRYLRTWARLLDAECAAETSTPTAIETRVNAIIDGRVVPIYSSASDNKVTVN